MKIALGLMWCTPKFIPQWWIWADYGKGWYTGPFVIFTLFGLTVTASINFSLPGTPPPESFDPTKAP